MSAQKSNPPPASKTPGMPPSNSPDCDEPKQGEAFDFASLSAPVAAWFQGQFSAPTEPQRFGWPQIMSGSDVLIAAPTGSGKTLTAFLTIIDRLVKQGLSHPLNSEADATPLVDTVYVSPLRALSYDIQRNLELPLAGILEEATRLGLSEQMPSLRTAVRTGDTTPNDRQKMLRRPPHILVTTPESLFLLLTARKSREILAGVKTIVVDEIHALARDKRGSHFSLTLERLDQWVQANGNPRPQRVGLSATQRPMDKLAEFLSGSPSDKANGKQAAIIDLGHQRELDLSILVPKCEELQAVMPKPQWEELLDEIAEIVKGHGTTLIFANQRRLAERTAHSLSERLGEGTVSAHHGSLAKERRLEVEKRLKDGELKALVATASLELGIDIGHIDCVVQIGSPRGIATFLQRVGRSGHALGLVPKGCLVPTTRDELVECAAVARAVLGGRLDKIIIPEAPLDILAQQLVALCADESWSDDDLFSLARRAAPFRNLQRQDFEDVLDLLTQGFETPNGRRGQHLHRDRIHHKVSGRRGARMAAITAGGAIPDAGDYRVILEPQGTVLGSVGEDWAIESNSGDIFLLGSQSWRVEKVENGTVRVSDAKGAPPSVPFWFGEAPARSAELSFELSQLRAEVVLGLEQIEQASDDAAEAQRLLELSEQIQKTCAIGSRGADQIIHYLRIQRDSAGRVPTQEDMLVERFFDEAGGMQLVIHSPFGARLNRGFGLALRKRFCRSFNMELQSAATDNAIILSLGNPQTFALETIRSFLSSKTVTDVLKQALLDSPMFAVRWRWNATRSLSVLRQRGGKRTPFNVLRMQTDDLLAAAFPDAAACQEHVSFPIDIPDHVLIRQTLKDCLHQACDIDGLITLLQRIESDEVRLHVVDTIQASPFAHEVVNARPYAFLDDAPLEERRTRAVSLRHVLPEKAQDLARLNPDAIQRLRAVCTPAPRDLEEEHELLTDLLIWPLNSPCSWLPERSINYEPWQVLMDAGRIGTLVVERDVGGDFSPDSKGFAVVFPLERLALAQALFPDAAVYVTGEKQERAADPRDAQFREALDAALRGHLELSGPVTAQAFAAAFAIEEAEIDASLIRLESRGTVLRGQFDEAISGSAEQWCERRLLARIHRETLEGLRKQVEPVSAQVFMRFLLRWQHLHPETRAAGENGLFEVLRRLVGFEAPLVAWETQLLMQRMERFRPTHLDALCLGGRIAWGRLTMKEPKASAATHRATPIAFFLRGESDDLLWSLVNQRSAFDVSQLSGPAERILEGLQSHGALFKEELQRATGLLPSEVDQGLLSLVYLGFASSDGFGALRRLAGLSRKAGRGARDRRRGSLGLAQPLSQLGGRWAQVRPLGQPLDTDTQSELAANRLLDRYGVVFRDLVGRERLPVSWRMIRRALTRLEARGLVRGGLFVHGLSGEQYARKEAVVRLRHERTRDEEDFEIEVSTCDPVNLCGVLMPGARVPARHTTQLVLRNGLPIATIEGGKRAPILLGASSSGA